MGVVLILVITLSNGITERIELRNFDTRGQCEAYRKGYQSPYGGWLYCKDK